MGREISLRASDETRSKHAPVEIRPSVVMTAGRYKEWFSSGQEGQRQIAAAFDQAVDDLVEKYQVVGKDRARGLREWLAVHICPYFIFKLLLERRLTINQDDVCRKKIEKAGQVLSDELLRLFNLEPAITGAILANCPFDEFPREHQAAKDWLELKNILLRAEKWEPVGGHTTRARNAAKPALKDLGDKIRCFWVTGWTSWLEKPKMPLEAPVISATSGYVQFAKYIYAFVKENCEEEGVIARLNAVEDRRASLPKEISEYQNLWKLLEARYGQAGRKKQAKKNNA